MLAVVVDPQVHIVGHYMKVGSLYNVLHGTNAGEFVCTHISVSKWLDLDYARLLIHWVRNFSYIQLYLVESTLVHE